MNDPNENPKIFTLPLGSFQPIRFISSAETRYNETEKKYPNSSNLDGKTVSDFYKEVISQESSQQNDMPQKPTTRKSKQKPRTTELIQVKEKLCSVSEFLKFCENNKVNKVKAQLDSDFPFNSVDNYGWTGLMCAACSGAESVVKLLLENGANKNVKDGKGRTAKELARIKNHYSIVQLIEKTKDKLNNEKQLTDSTNDLGYDCGQCNESFKDPKSEHEKSIYHHLNRGFKGEKTFYNIMDNNIGFKMMLKNGWNQEMGLGPSGSGQKFPVKTILKRDRHGLGIRAKEKPRVTHFEPFDISAVSNKRPHSIKKSKKLEKIRKKKQEEKERLKEIDFRKQFH